MIIAALMLVALECSALHGAEPKSTSDFELKIDGNSYLITYKGKQELHQVTGTVTFICQGGHMTMPRLQLWTSWKPGEVKTVVEDRAKPDQIQLDCVGRVCLVEGETTAPRDYNEVPLRAQWDGETAKEVLFVGKGGARNEGVVGDPRREQEGFFNALSKDQEVALKETENGYQIQAILGTKATHKVVQVAGSYVVLKDLGGETEIRIPFHAVKSIVRANKEGK
jgi:hypothetical protein